MKKSEFYDDKRFSDPVPEGVDTLPKSKYTAVVPLRRLRRLDENRMAVRINAAGIIMGLIPICIGLLCIGLFILALLRPDIVKSWHRNNSASILMPLAGLLVGYGGIALLKHLSKPFLFDRSQGRFSGGEEVRLSSICALQFIVIDDGANSELNMVTKGGGRIHLLSSPRIQKMEDDAKGLSAFLGKPLVRAEIRTEARQG